MQNLLTYPVIDAILYVNRNKAAEMIGRERLLALCERFGLNVSDWIGWIPDGIIVELLAYSPTGKNLLRAVEIMQELHREHPDEAPEHYIDRKTGERKTLYEYWGFRMNYIMPDKRDIYELIDLFQLPKQDEKFRAGSVLGEHILKIWHESKIPA